jgi:UDP-galactopyranose mutase
VLERRDHIGGNCYSYNYEDTEINVHAYGTHVFHTSDKRIWDYINRFTEFNRYQHRVLTTAGGEVFSMPINLGTINAFFGINLRPQDAEAFSADRTATVIMREFSQVDRDDPYYPVNTEADKGLCARYATLARTEGHVIFGGRLANYKYHDMHQVIGSALTAARNELTGAD